MSQRDGLGSASHAPRYRTSGTKGTVDIPAVVQRWGVVPEGPEGTASWVIATTLPVFPEELARDAWRGVASPNRDLLAAGEGGVVGENEEAVRRSLSTHKPCNSEEGEIALPMKMWVPLAVRPAAEQNQKILHPALLRGREWRSLRHLLKSSSPHLRVARVRAA